VALSGSLGIQALADSVEMGVSEIGCRASVDTLEETGLREFIIALLILPDQVGYVLTDSCEAATCHRLFGRGAKVVGDGD
jgi:hypothetical protein